MNQLWKVEWDNERREVLWRLSVNGVHGAGGHDIVFPGPCRCGWAGPSAGGSTEADRQRRAHRWRFHHFLEGPVAAAVREGLWDGLGSARRNPSCADVWLLHPPPGVCGGVWQVVWAALEAMERGRKVLWASEEEDEDGQTLITDFFPTLAGAAGPPEPPAPVLVMAVQRAQRRATAWFWCILQDFVHQRSDL